MPYSATVTVSPGVTYARLNEALAEFERFLPPAPATGGYCTIGGMIATNAAGMNSVKYGSILDYVESLELVLANGTVIETQRRDVRQAAFKQFIAGRDPDARLHKGVYELLRDHRGLIRSKMPKLVANASGYRLDAALGRGVLDLGRQHDLSGGRC